MNGTGMGRQLALCSMLRYTDLLRLGGRTLYGLRRFLSEERLVRVGHQFVINSFLPPFPGESFEQLLRGVGGLKEGHVIPVSAYVAVTGACRYRCWHCSHAHRSGRPLSTAELLRAIRELQDLGVCIIGLTGGEPLLRDDLESVVRSVDARSTTLLFTSGDGLDLVRARRLKESGLFGVAVSLDHVEAETHDRGRGQKGAFLAACRAIEAGREAGLYTMAQLVARREVADESWLRRYLDFVGGLGVQEVRLLEPMPTGLLLGTSGTTGIGCTGREELRKVHRRSNRVSTGVKVSSFAVIEDSEHYGCGAGFQHLYIDAHGHVCPCDFSPISFGNVATEPVGSIWLRMRESFQRPRCECFLQTRAQEISRAFKGELPLEVARVPERVFRCEDERLPSYYRVLGWQEDGASGQGWNVRRAGGMTCVPEAGDAA